MKSNRYTDNWKEIALSVKESVDWKCRRCIQQCLRPGEQKQLTITKAQLARLTLDVHHANCIPEDNRLEDLIPTLQAVSYHTARRSLFKYYARSVEFVC